MFETGELVDPSAASLVDLGMLHRDRGPVALAVLISGTGRTLENLLNAIRSGRLNAGVRVVVSSKAGVRGLNVAADAGIPTLVVAPRDYSSDHEYSSAIYRVIRPFEPELLILAGFLRKLVVPAYLENRILNIHPALIPESDAAGHGFYGPRVHQAVIDSGASHSGATVHVVDNGYDTGPVVMKATVPIFPEDTADTLAERVFLLECVLYPAAIRKHIAAHPRLFGE